MITTKFQIGSEDLNNIFIEWDRAKYICEYLTDDGKIKYFSPTLWTWGRNNAGQLGLSTIVDRSSPIQIGSLTNWKLIAGGYYISFAIKTNGTLWGWGFNGFGTLGLNDTTHRSSPVQVGLLTNWQQITCGWCSALAVKTNGTLWSCGDNGAGLLGLNDRTHRSSPTQVGTLTDWKYVSTGVYGTHVLAIKTDGTIWSWGDNSYGGLGVGDQTNRSSPVQIGLLTDWKSVSGGYYHSLAIKTDGTLWGWGYNGTGQLGLGDNTSRSSPTQVGTLTNWKLIGGGFYYYVATKTDGSLWGCGGRNEFGQLGFGNTSSNISSPVQVGSLTNWRLVSGGVGHTMALTTNYSCP